MARLYADEHFPVAIVFVLRRLGHDVITVRETGLSKMGEGTPDELVLQFAAQQRRIVVTFNERDFRRLHGLNARHSGIVCCPEPAAASAKKVARQIDRFLKKNEMNSRFEKLPPL
jgi:hypothetical protein